jgi:hypothetical protein
MRDEREEKKSGKKAGAWKYVLLSSLIISLLSLFGCANPLITPKDKDAPADGAGLVLVDLGGVNARTMLPAAAGLYYTLDFKQGGASVKTASIASGGAASVKLAAGTYDLDVKGYLDADAAANTPAAYVVQGGVTGIVVSDGATTPVNVELTAAITDEGTGNLTYEYSFPAYTTTATLTISTITGGTATTIDLLTTAGANTYTAINRKAIGAVTDLPSGYYSVKASAVRDGVEKPYATRYDIAHVYDGLTTAAKYAFASGDFAAYSPGNDIGETLAGGPGLYAGAVTAESVPLVTATATALHPLDLYLDYIKANAADNSDYTIVLANDAPIVTGPILLGTAAMNGKTGVHITLVGLGGERVIQLDPSGDPGPLFSVDRGGSTTAVNDIGVPYEVPNPDSSSTRTLTLGNNITLKGTAYNSASLVYVGDGSTLIMEAGSKITGNTNANVSGGGSTTDIAGGVFVYRGTFTMNGGAIAGNTKSGGLETGVGGVAVGLLGTFTMGGSAVISGNTGTGTRRPDLYPAGSAGFGMGVGGVYNESVFTMGGSAAIIGNTGNGPDRSAGGLYVSAGATFTKTGGLITGVEGDPADDNRALGSAATKGNAAVWSVSNRRLSGDLAGNLALSGTTETPADSFDPEVTGVTVSGPSTATKGASALRYAAVLGGYHMGPAQQGVTWTLAGNSHGDTRIDPYSGDLAVDLAETSASLTVTATSIFNPAVSGYAIVAVSGTAPGARAEGLYKNGGTTPETLPGTGVFFTEALAAIKADTTAANTYAIVVGTGFSSAPVTLNAAAIGNHTNITIEGSSGEKAITLASAGSLFTVPANVTLTLGDHITLQGISANNSPLVTVSGANGKLVMQTGSKLTGNTNTGTGNLAAAGVYVSVANAQLSLEGGAITNNHATGVTGNTHAGGVLVVNGKFTMTGGTISGNTAAGATGVAGGVFFQSSAANTFTMSGGAITGNMGTAVTNNTAGGVFLGSSNSGFSKSGPAAIYGNSLGAGTGGLIKGAQVLYYASATNVRVIESDLGPNADLATTATAGWTLLPLVTGITGGSSPTAHNANVAQGGTYPYAATVNVVNGAPTTVTWSITTANLDPGTSVTQDGQLTVGAGEANTSLGIRATSTYDTSKYYSFTAYIMQVKSVAVAPQTIYVAKGANRQFTEDVTVAPSTISKSVTWTLNGVAAGSSTAGGSSINTDGLVTVGNGEAEGASLTVTATSVFDPRKSGAATVIVGAAPPKTVAGLYADDGFIDLTGQSGANTLAKAFAWLAANGAANNAYTVLLDEDADLATPPNLGTIKQGSSLTLEGLGTERTIRLTSGNQLFSVASNQTLVLGNRITLYGGGYIFALVYVNSGGYFVMKEGSKITGSGAYGVNSSGYFTMDGGTITGNNSTTYAGGVYVSGGTFTMNDGATITGNSVTGNNANANLGFAGGVYLMYGTFTMHGGTISGNTASNANTGATALQAGGIGISSNVTAIFTKAGGTIAGVAAGDPADNTVTGAAPNKGNAVFWANGNRKVDGDLGPTDNLSTSPAAGWD